MTASPWLAVAVWSIPVSFVAALIHLRRTARKQEDW